MSNQMPDAPNALMKKVVEIAIRLGVLLLILYWCFSIVSPFVEITLWGIIFAVALYPVHRWVSRKLWNKKALASVVVALLMIVIFILPAYFFASSFYEGVMAIKSHFDGPGPLLPQAPPQILDWPLIGTSVYDQWNWVANNLSQAAQEHLPEIKAIGMKVVSGIASAGAAYLKLIVAIIIAAVMLVYAESGSQLAQNIFVKVAGSKGEEYLQMSSKTIRSVVKGILGVAFIQSALVGIGFAVAGIPATGLWVMLALILGIIQIGPLPVIIIGVIYMFSTAATTPAIIFLVWCIIIAPLDNILKPILLGKGAAVPMLVIFIGAIGGFIFSGIVGLFTGAIVFSIGYRVFDEWLQEGTEQVQN